MLSSLELISVLFNLVYLILLIRRNIWCWLFGFLGSVTGIKVMYDFGLRIEPWLYLFYALVAIYGYFHWKNEGSKNLEYKLTELPIKNHIGWILTGVAFTFLFGWLFDNFSTGESTYLDAFTTGFAVIATVLQTRKIKSNFIYWIIINIASTYLYFSREMKFYPWLMVLYVIISIYGARKWMQKT